MAKLTKKEKMERKDPLAQLYALDLGENLRARRTALGWTQEGIAYNMATKHPRISNIENGLVDARISDVVALARILEVEPCELLDFSARKLEDCPEQSPDSHAKP